jgi:NADH dehydrogenase/NADH:ubiquinone oxidoreductase subunit G
MTILMDGRPISLEGPATLLEAARANGIAIPSLCDHPGLAPYAACRICLVEVKGRRGYVPACSTMAEEGMEVVTASPAIRALRRGILELILSEHPHACLICAEKSSCDDYKSTIRKTGEVTGCVLCPNNGRCELQRVVEAVGLELVPYSFARRAGEVRRDDPFIDRDNSLCILCGRCVRVCQEIRGASVLTFVARGSETVIGTALDRRLLDSACQFCGACVDVCPTGALTDRTTRYERPAESEARSVCTLCGQGCGLLVQTRSDRIVRTLPDPEGRVNHGQACVKGRFLVRTALAHPRRLRQPLVRENGNLRESDWEYALTSAASRLAGIGAGQVALAASAQSSCEDLFLLHRFAAEVLGGASVAGPWSDSAAAALKGLDQGAALNFAMEEIAEAGTIVVVGVDLALTQPIVGLHVNRAVTNGSALIRVEAGKGFADLARRLDSAKPVLVLFGPELIAARQGSARLAELRELVARVGGRLVALDRDSNIRGALALSEAFSAGPASKAPRVLYIAGPIAPPPKPGRTGLVIVHAGFEDELIAAADFVFPEALPFEVEGTFVNVEGRIQIAPAVVPPPGQARPGWWIFKELAGRLGAKKFAYESPAEVRAAMAAGVHALAAAAGPGEAPMFVAEETGAAPGRPTPPGRAGKPALRDPDVWHGLRLAEESKGLKVVRGR